MHSKSGSQSRMAIACGLANELIIAPSVWETVSGSRLFRSSSRSVLMSSADCISPKFFPGLQQTNRQQRAAKSRAAARIVVLAMGAPVNVKDIEMKEQPESGSGSGGSGGSGGARQNIQSPRGTKDILPGETEKWQQMEAHLGTVLQRAGYREIRLPMFEHTELFHRGVGETTDIVNKEMYTFLDRSDRSLTLRPEGTAGVVRAYLAHGLSRQPSPVKLWYCGPMFRYERTQTGRQRQFHQTGIEVFGSAGPAIDAEVIILALDCVHSIGIKNFALHLNSIGCVNCRPIYREKLKDAL